MLYVFDAADRELPAAFADAVLPPDLEALIAAADEHDIPYTVYGPGEADAFEADVAALYRPLPAYQEQGSEAVARDARRKREQYEDRISAKRPYPYVRV